VFFETSERLPGSSTLPRSLASGRFVGLFASWYRPGPGSAFHTSAARHEHALKETRWVLAGRYHPLDSRVNQDRSTALMLADPGWLIPRSLARRASLQPLASRFLSVADECYGDALAAATPLWARSQGSQAGDRVRERTRDPSTSRASASRPSLPASVSPPLGPEMIAETLAYMAPEQTRSDESSVTRARSLFAGLTFLRDLVGEGPFTATSRWHGGALPHRTASLPARQTRPRAFRA